MQASVKLKVLTKDGEEVKAEYLAWNVPIYENKDFNPSQKFLDNMETGEALIDAMTEYFLEALDNTDYAKSCVEGIGGTDRISKLTREDMKKLEISSLLDCEEEGFGSDITYDFETKKRKRKNTGWSDF